jgi:hypothetical protein
VLGVSGRFETKTAKDEVSEVASSAAPPVPARTASITLLAHTMT